MWKEMLHSLMRHGMVWIIITVHLSAEGLSGALDVLTKLFTGIAFLAFMILFTLCWVGNITGEALIVLLITVVAFGLLGALFDYLSDLASDIDWTQKSNASELENKKQQLMNIEGKIKGLFSRKQELEAELADMEK